MSIPTQSITSWSPVLSPDLVRVPAAPFPLCLARFKSGATPCFSAATSPTRGFHRRLRLRDAGQFVPTLLRGFFIQQNTEGESPRFVVPRRPTEPSPEPFRSFLSEFDTLFEFYPPQAPACRPLPLGAAVVRGIRSWSGMWASAS